MTTISRQQALAMFSCVLHGSIRGCPVLLGLSLEGGVSGPKR